MLKTLGTLLAACGLGAGLLGVPGHADEPKQTAQKAAPAKGELQKLMERKLKQSQALLGAVAESDFKKISSACEELLVISQLAAWKVHQTPRYELFTNEFRRSVEEMKKKAEAKNIDGVSLAYLDMTLSCVRCHKYVREIRQTRIDRPSTIPSLAFDR